jgi:hypothetical protein
MDSFIPQTSLFLGIIPALILLYISLKGYEGHFKEKLIFLTFIVGLIIGFVAAVLEILTSEVGLLFIFLFPILEQLFKTIILNLGRFQEKQETTIYGLCLGLGFGSVFTPASIIMGNYQTADIAFLSALIGSFGLILFHAASGTIIGYGIYAGKLTKYLTMAIIIQLPITVVIFLTSLFQVGYVQISLVIYGIVVYWYATKRIMPRILAETQRRKRTQKEIEIKSR